MTRRQNRLENRYPARRTRTRKMSDSSSSSEVGKVYSLRERPPKNQKSSEFFFVLISYSFFI